MRGSSGTSSEAASSHVSKLCKKYGFEKYYVNQYESTDLDVERHKVQITSNIAFKPSVTYGSVSTENAIFSIYPILMRFHTNSLDTKY